MFVLFVYIDHIIRIDKYNPARKKGLDPTIKR